MLNAPRSPRSIRSAHAAIHPALASIVAMLAVSSAACTPRATRSQCLYTSDCTAPLVCLERLCRSACQAAVDCPMGQPCVTVGPNIRACQAPPMNTGGTACASPMDLSAVPMGADGAIHVMGDNTSAQMGTTIPTVCIDPMFGYAGYQVAYRYTMRATGILTASTVSMNTALTLDTVVQIAAGCDSAAATLGCNDDVSSSVRQSTAASWSVIDAGTAVFILVGGFVSPMVPSTPQGPFELILREGST